jgi:uncharacterized protein
MHASAFEDPNSGPLTKAHRTQRTAVASNGHALGLVAIILAFAVAGRLLVGNQPAENLEEFGRIPIYLLGLASMWCLVAYAVMGVRRGAVSVRQLIDASAWSLRRWLLYALIAIAMFLAWVACGAILGRFLRPGPEEIRNILVLLPKGTAEKALWIVLSLSAGFCEEFVYRGYLLRRFHELTGYLSIGLVLQAVFYGIAHAALPWQIVLLVTCLGLLFGSVAAWKQTLVPGMLMHAALDLLALARR